MKLFPSGITNSQLFFFSYSVIEDCRIYNYNKAKFSNNYPDLILFSLDFPSDFKVPADSPSEEASIDLEKLLERSA